MPDISSGRAAARRRNRLTWAGLGSIAGILGIVVLIVLITRPDSIEARPWLAPHSEWTFTCYPAKGAVTEADDAFSALVADRYAREGGPAAAERKYLGLRIEVEVDVVRPGMGIQKGRYRLYGTVSQIDYETRRMTLRDCALR